MRAFCFSKCKLLVDYFLSTVKHQLPPVLISDSYILINVECERKLTSKIRGKL